MALLLELAGNDAPVQHPFRGACDTHQELLHQLSVTHRVQALASKYSLHQLRPLLRQHQQEYESHQ